MSYRGCYTATRTHWRRRQSLAIDLSDGTTSAGIRRANFYDPLGNLAAVDVALGDTATGVTHTTWLFADPGTVIRTVGRYDTANSVWLLLHRLTDEFGNLYDVVGDPAGLADDHLAAVPLYIGGMELDAATGLYRAGSRWYDPTAGRFLTPTASSDYAFTPLNPMDLANGNAQGGAPSRTGRMGIPITYGTSRTAGPVRSAPPPHRHGPIGHNNEWPTLSVAKSMARAPLPQSQWRPDPSESVAAAWRPL
ncbi:hypothetical protein [Symmachiella macrocystis]|uniref:hypothetical protein n=1 Tax=Symmachiella macrocystis TaxID=2527985 RepID=UPI0011B7B179|nr:hypothetical protein [Symmachiella macrocystis]